LEQAQPVVSPSIQIKERSIDKGSTCYRNELRSHSKSMTA